MEEKLSNELEQQLRENDILAEWLGEARFTARILSDIDDALSVLAAKRTTLEEKIITQELHSLAAKFCLILNSVHWRLRENNSPREDVLEKLRTLNFQVHETVETLLKALRYNLNYVEQYFEHNFAARLTNELKYTAEAEALVDMLKD
ncbi:MAG TPA: hypothetical protein V6D22_23815 [Candidatus Obscuribacterales bacterium]